MPILLSCYSKAEVVMIEGQIPSFSQLWLSNILLRDFNLLRRPICMVLSFPSMVMGQLCSPSSPFTIHSTPWYITSRATLILIKAPDISLDVVLDSRLGILGTQTSGGEQLISGLC